MSLDLQSIRSICLSMPGVTEDIKWENHLCFSVGGKMFLVTGPDEVPVTASFKVSDEEFGSLPERPGFKPAPYMARNKWIFTNDIANFSLREWQHYLKEAYLIVRAKLPKKLQKEIGEV